MSRTPISATEVRAAFEKLLSQATEPTAQNIRDLLEKGNIPVHPSIGANSARRGVIRAAPLADVMVRCLRVLR